MKEARISKKEFNVIAACLAKWTNPILVDVWHLYGGLVFSHAYERAALEIVDNKVRINVNPKCWKRWSKYKKTFIVAHELLHGIFCHWLIPDDVDREWTNIAQDIQVNEYINSHWPALTLGLSKSEELHATVENVFKNYSGGIPRDKNYPYYYELMQRCLK